MARRTTAAEIPPDEPPMEAVLPVHPMHPVHPTAVPPPEEPPPVLRSPQNFINRELSSLEFNQRVLAQSLDPRVPLLERLNFLCISSSNLDEFFEIRVAGLKQLLELGSAQIGSDGLGLAEQLAAIHARANGPGARSVRLPERRAAARAARRRHRRARRRGLGRTDPRLGRASLRRRSRAGAESAGSRSGAAVSAHSEQEPQFHRAPVGQGRLWPRQRAGDRAGAALTAAHRAVARQRHAPALRRAVHHRRSLGGAPVRRRGGAGLLSVPPDAQQRPVRRR